MLPLSLAIAVGRFGCFFGGLPDQTYGTPTALPWAVDFGDGIGRHPVQLYEIHHDGGLSRLVLLAAQAHGEIALRHGFYLFAIVYGVQRFLWEFLKPYPTLLGPFNVFHLLCLAMIAYAVSS